MRTEWKKVKLGDIATTIQPGPFGSQLHSSDYSDEGTPIIMPKDMIDGKVKLDSLAKVPDKHLQRLVRHQVFDGDLMVARKGDVRKCIIITKNENGWLTGSDCLKVCLNKANSFPKFIYYQLKSPFIGKWLETISIGATMPSINTTLLGSIELSLPPLETQQKIAGILSAYDDLIENNRKQIKLLEEAAQRLYKEWFVKLNFPGHENTKIVDGVPEGWTTKTVEELGEYLNGYAFKPSDWKTEGLPIIKIKEMNQGITKDTPRNSGEQIPRKYIIKTGDIVFSWSATLAVVIWTSETGLLNQHLFKVTPATGICREFVFQTIKYELDAFSNLTTGATMKHIQRNKLSQLSLAVPDKKIMSLYDNIVDPIREKIINSQLSILNLQTARDKLLPKLMNGFFFLNYLSILFIYLIKEV